MATVTTSRGVAPAAAAREDGWTPEFVRGIAAAAMTGLQETSFNSQSRVISFRHPDGPRINVYYTTKTIGTALDHPSNGSTQLFRRNCSQVELIEILKNPRVHTGHGYYRAPKRARIEADVHNSALARSAQAREEDVSMEVDFRNRLKDLDDEISDLMAKRSVMWHSISTHDAARLNQSVAMHRQTEQHQITIAEEVGEQQEEQRRRECTCSHCGRELANSAAVQQHIQAVHEGFSCYECGKWCQTQASLNQHIDATGHY